MPYTPLQPGGCRKSAKLARSALGDVTNSGLRGRSQPQRFCSSPFARAASFMIATASRHYSGAPKAITSNPREESARTASAVTNGSFVPVAPLISCFGG